MSPQVELTLVVAATRAMGIGAKGGLPWTGLKKEMAYFARVSPTACNAVIMGRKTWDSIPIKFRPLKDRLNIVISRSSPAPTKDQDQDQNQGTGAREPVRVASLEQALEFLRSRTPGTLGRVFVIGGAQIYDAALKLPESKRLLITRVLSDFDCDTFFPLKPTDEGECPPGWESRPKAELDDWAGEVVPEGVQVENGTEYEFQMWEKSQ